MNDRRYIVVRNWERFQHPDAARSAVPPWIKLYTELLSDEAYLALTPTRRSMLLGLWQEYARTRRRLPEDTRTLSRRLAQRVLSSDLEVLAEAGFIEFSASEPASNVASNPARLEKRREEVRTPIPAASAGDASINGDFPSDRSDGFEPERLVDPTASPCLICGTPVRPGYRCPNCNANPRAAGSSPRQTARRITRGTAYERAAAYTRNEGYQYDLAAFRSDLERFGLADHERRDLERLRDSVLEQVEGF